MGSIVNTGVVYGGQHITNVTKATSGDESSSHTTAQGEMVQGDRYGHRVDVHYGDLPDIVVGEKHR
ncbi:hypothetical protein [Streptantibioticus silvisoli]|uniref:Uncharacterized protein n=1 Tax=Streptantibioticus silvisoli TaxID=2705255 RepID=A0ABT6W4U6_9ACTN|nr:hypothetical protein [Streptantibioticus silvisoli]MDI5965746.1 hypothetical protein [Streptantibioticus silvisoli]